jgi:uncharacterized membrane protein YeaQ/YmgE (transglycosylase-associated protein family)
MTGSIAAVTLIGALLFGVVVGWITYGTLRRAQRNSLTDLTTVIGAIGGATVTGLFPKETGAFGAYCVGLAVGFFGYLIVAVRPGAPDWLGAEPGSSPGGGGVPIPPRPTRPG